MSNFLNQPYKCKNCRHLVKTHSQMGSMKDPDRWNKLSKAFTKALQEVDDRVY